MHFKHILAIAALATLAACNNKPTETTDANADTTVVHDNMSTTTTTPTDNAMGHTDAVGETHEVGVMGSGPHSGIIAEAGENNHLEMAMNGKDVDFYLLDRRTEPVDASDASGKVVVQYADGDSKTANLKNESGKLVAANVNTGEKFKAIVTLMHKGETLSATFNSDGSNGGHDPADGHMDHHHDSNEPSDHK